MFGAMLGKLDRHCIFPYVFCVTNENWISIKLLLFSLQYGMIVFSLLRSIFVYLDLQV